MSISYGATHSVTFSQAAPLEPPKRKARTFAGAQTGRLLSDWAPGTTTRNDKIQRSLKAMRSRCRQLVDDNEYAKKIIQLHQDNVIGAQGLSLTVLARDSNQSLDILANDAIRDAWNEWGKMENCTVKGSRSWWHVQRTCARCEPQAGEVFIRMVRGFDNKFSFALQMLNPDCVDEELNNNLPNGNKIRMGIERNSWGRVVAYYIRKENPYDSFSTFTKHERVDAADIIHKFMPLGEDDEVRGVPWFHAPMKGMRMLESYDEAAMTAAQFGAANAGFMKELPDANGHYIGDGEDEDGNTMMEVSPGQMVKLPRGIDVTQFDVKYPHELYAYFIKARVRTMAAGVPGVNYNQLAGDYESVNYSSLRAAFLESQDAFMAVQRDFIEVVAEKIFSEWLKMALLVGAILVNGKPLPVDKFEKFNQPKFVPRGWPWVDPEKEVKAAKESVASGFSSRSEIISRQGKDPDTVRAQQESDVKNDRDYQLDFDLEKTRNRADVVGVLGRAGLLTPTQKDEERIRYEFNLPPMSPEAVKAWKEDGGARRPITLQVDEPPKPATKAAPTEKPAP